MKKFLIAFFGLLITIIVIAVFTFFCMVNILDFRFVTEDDQITFKHKVNYEKYVNKTLDKSYIVITEGDSSNTYYLSDIGTRYSIDGIIEDSLKQDISNVKVIYDIADSTMIKDIKNSRVESVDASIKKVGNKFELVNYIPSNEVDINKLISDINNELNRTIKVGDSYSFKYNLDNYSVSNNEYDTTNLESIIERINNWHLSYINGYSIDMNNISEYIELSDNKVIINSEEELKKNLRRSIEARLGNLSTLYTDKEFIKRDGSKFVSFKGSYGNNVDYDAETDYVLNLIETFTTEENREPVYSIEMEMDYNDGTYIELSIKDQHWWYYQNGEVVLDSDCVTGLDNGERNTPIGFYFIRNHAKDPTLTGPGYEAHVDRWMAITAKGIGFHDASWRSSFGGQIYKTNGSHGCVNCPKEAMFKLYDMVKDNTPVIIY